MPLDKDGFVVVKETDGELSYVRVFAFIAGLLHSHNLSANDISEAVDMVKGVANALADQPEGEGVKGSAYNGQWLLAECLIQLMRKDDATMVEPRTRTRQDSEGSGGSDPESV